MLSKKQMGEIQDMKWCGYTKSDIIRYYETVGEVPPSRPTVSKYYDMDSVPKNPGEKLAKERVFDAEPFRSTIIAILEANAGKDFCMSSVYDVLEEKFVENGSLKKLPGNQQTLRNYIHYLESAGVVDRKPACKRTYRCVGDMPPGQQMLVDFGKVVLSNRKSIYFFCLLLRYSRFLCVYAQDHKFSTPETCRAIYGCFCRLGGRPKQLVIDQDAVFVSGSSGGKVTLTPPFSDFCREQNLKLWVCHKHDPESKGPVENTVGFVKKNFFSARTFTSIEDVWRSLPGWLARKNSRIHQATLRVPKTVFESTKRNGYSRYLTLTLEFFVRKSRYPLTNRAAYTI